VTGTGKILRRHAMQSHILEHTSAKRQRAFDKDFEVAEVDKPRLKKLLGLK
jgi:large subunit ribosomal protein L35